MLKLGYSYNKIFLGIYVQFIFILFIVYSKSTYLHSNIHFTDDAIVINTGKEVKDEKEIAIGIRKKRQYESFLQPSVTCLTYHGRAGVCSSYRQCYQDYPDVFLYQGWLSGMQNTCSYYTPFGHQAYGVCCTSDQSSSHPNEIQPSHPFWFGTPLFQPRPLPPSNWPPPIPTHPPNHTAPTHPPTHPAPITTPIPPSKPTTIKPPWVPSTQPTRPTRPTRPSTIPVKPTNPTTEPDYGYNNYTECGIKNGYQDQERIVGGHNAEPGEWPWMAAILNNGKLFCGGSLIDNNHILTAAHCVAQMGPWDVARLRINLGDHNIKNKMEVKHVERKVKKVVRHRGFDFQTLYNDVALLTLDSPVTFSSRIRPICLPQGKSLYTGRNATVTGWGSIREMGPAPGVLQEVNIPIWTNSDCKQKYGNAAPGGIIDTFLCAGKASKDSCSGDSGGPLMINEDRWYQIGIVSWGIGCGKGQYPGVYTRITSFMPWINKNLNT